MLLSSLECVSSPTKRMMWKTMTLNTGQKLSTRSVLPLLALKMNQPPNSPLVGQVQGLWARSLSLVRGKRTAPRCVSSCDEGRHVPPHAGHSCCAARTWCPGGGCWSPPRRRGHAHGKYRECWSPTPQALLRWQDTLANHFSLCTSSFSMAFGTGLDIEVRVWHLLSHKCQCPWLWLNRDRETSREYFSCKQFKETVWYTYMWPL